MQGIAAQSLVVRCPFWAAAAPTRAGDFLFTHHTLVVAYQLVRLLISSLV
jgi:hypothetical protein